MARGDGAFPAERIYSKDGIHNAEARDCSAKIGIQQNRNEGRIAIEEVVRVPEERPGNEDDEQSEFKPQKKQNRAKETMCQFI